MMRFLRGISLSQAGRTAAGTGMMINSSRAILYASSGADFAAAARTAAERTRAELHAARSH